MWVHSEHVLKDVQAMAMSSCDLNEVVAVNMEAEIMKWITKA